jgi:hypothetical protein
MLMMVRTTDPTTTAPTSVASRVHPKVARPVPMASGVGDAGVGGAVVAKAIPMLRASMAADRARMADRAPKATDRSARMARARVSTRTERRATVGVRVPKARARMVAAIAAVSATIVAAAIAAATIAAAAVVEIAGMVASDADTSERMRLRLRPIRARAR